MSYLPERDGLAAYPDDPARTEAPLGLSFFEEEFHHHMVRQHQRDLVDDAIALLLNQKSFMHIKELSRFSDQSSAADVCLHLLEELRPQELQTILMSVLDSSYQQNAKTVLHSYLNKLVYSTAQAEAISQI